ncbi:hypothetical protein PAHAL_9G156000 [Panicum hallii]|uniref:FBD domain-containing protein n=1 Tax=Panicum hallii TaxID=206008 RepID=A0A2T8I1D9_9POAL|nr:hypothetical protein PAHAL_9G156000 [Panicum hallii]
MPSVTCCRAGLLCRSTRIQRRGVGANHISALPDSMLLQVLVCLGCARRWRGLWALLPELTFHNIGPEPLRSALAQDNLGDVTRSFEQEMSRIPVRNISCLALELATEEHVYGAVLLDLLGLCSSIQRLQVTLNQYDNEVKACSVNCPCHQPYNWRSQIISLTDLKEVSIEGFEGEEHEVGLLKVLLRCAAMLERVTINFSRNVPRSCSAYMELPSILKAHPSVKFKIYRWCGDQVLFG